jgi:HrpA-like RNA helicase
MNTDILLGLLSRIVPLRRELYNEQQSIDNQSQSQQKQKNQRKKQTNPPIKTKVQCPLKLVIMSATLRVEVHNEN